MEFPYSITLPVLFRDVDLMGHVNNVIYFTWFEAARTGYLVELFECESPRDLPVILAETACQFKAPAFWGDTVLVGCAVSRLGTKSFDLAYRVETTTGRLLAEGSSVQVCYDYQANATTLLPDWFRERVAARQATWRSSEGR
ncbi:MAG TPA: acyl-CoA thioesterase [Chloroflexi bacterium]|nr:acyl-CoA thioesterase [Chloroflexota bacterium]